MARVGLIAVLLLALLVAMTGIRWGLPSRRADAYLFGTRPPWSGERLVELKGRAWQQSRKLGADVDIDPISTRNLPVDLTATDQDRAAILVRYRLYTHQPDELITLRALAGMRPMMLWLDPKLYQYGGLFIYPVGLLIGLASACGLLGARADLAYFFEHPADFGSLYVVLRAYSATFGLIGVVACYLIGRRLGRASVGLLAGVLFVLMPVVITLSHEGKPHLPGAVLMLLAGLAAMRYVESGRPGRWWTTAVSCGLASAMVLSAWPVMATMIAAIWQRPCDSPRQTARRLIIGLAVAATVFLVVNPYLLINLVKDREVLRSNLGGSVDMYQMGRLGEGAWTVGALLVEGMGPVLAAAGAAALVLLLARRAQPMLPLVLPMVLVLAQFVCIGAGKPGEYGRFLLFPAAVLVIAAAWGIASAYRWRRVLGVGLAGIVLATTAWDGYRYLAGFVRDAGTTGSRNAAAAWLSTRLADDPYATVGLLREPAPYCVPPVDFDRRRVVLLPQRPSGKINDWPDYIVTTADRPDAMGSAWWAWRYRQTARFPTNLNAWWNRPTVISWADKPVVVFRRRVESHAPPATQPYNQSRDRQGAVPGSIADRS